MRARPSTVRCCAAIRRRFGDEYGDADVSDVRRAAERRAADGTAASNRPRCGSRPQRDVLTVAPREHGHVFIQDLRYALRTMAARPGFTAVADPVAGARHRRQHRDLQLVERRPARLAAGVRDPGELVMLTDPDEAGMWSGTLERPHRRPASLAHLRRIRAAAGSRRRLLGLMASQSSLSTWQVRFEGEAAGWEEARGRLVSGGVLPGAGRRPRRSAGSSRPTTDRVRHRRRRHQLQLLAATLRRPSRRARARPSRSASDRSDHHRRRAVGLRRRNQRPAAGPLAAAATAAQRAARQQLAARHAARQGDVAPRVRPAEARRDARRRRKAEANAIFQAGLRVVLWRGRLRGTPRASSWISASRSSPARAAHRRCASSSPSR